MSNAITEIPGIVELHHAGIPARFRVESTGPRSYVIREYGDPVAEVDTGSGHVTLLGAAAEHVTTVAELSTLSRILEVLSV